MQGKWKTDGSRDVKKKYKKKMRNFKAQRKNLFTHRCSKWVDDFYMCMRGWDTTSATSRVAAAKEEAKKIKTDKSLDFVWKKPFNKKRDTKIKISSWGDAFVVVAASIRLCAFFSPFFFSMEIHRFSSLINE